MISSQFLEQALAWVLTYAVHSTLLLFSAWLVTRGLSSERLRWHERVWKAALFGGLFSASLQLALGVSPAGGRLEWTSAPVETHGLASLPLEPGVLRGAAGWESLGLEFGWERLLIGLWLLGGLIGVVLLLFAWRRISDRLAGREVLKRGPAFESLARLARQGGLGRAPRLTVSKHLRSPATVGVFLPQICVPRRALSELSLEQQEALIAHELAHVLRRDPLWFFGCGLVERVLFFQPLNRLARRELQEVAEFLSDDWAAQATGNELGLARCLTEVATWVLDLRPQVALVPMASRNSRLAARIGRLLDEDRQPQDHGRRKRGPALALLAVAGGVLVLPGAASVSPQESPAAMGAPDAPRPAAARAPHATTDEQADRGEEERETDLDDLLAILDEEVEGLATEVGELDAELAIDPSSPDPRAHTLRDLAQRVQSLRQRRERLRQLLPDLQRELAGADGPHHPRNPKQEESR